MNTRNDHVVVVKECHPGLLIELDSSLTTILSTRMLHANQGLIHPNLKADKLEFFRAELRQQQQNSLDRQR